jgi:predicted RNase H-like HicB family nuclease
MKFTAVYQPDEEGGYIAYIEEIPGVNTQGDTLVEAKANLIDAFKMVIEERRKLAEEEITSYLSSGGKNIIREEIILE